MNDINKELCEIAILVMTIVLILFALYFMFIRISDMECGKTEQFETISRKRYQGDTYIEIIYDKETKVKYIHIDGYHGEGITALIDENGKPLLYEGE